MSVSQDARAFLAAGFKPVLIVPGTKRPTPNGWQRNSYDEGSIAAFDAPNVGIGLQWGLGHVDIDLEDQTVATIAARLMPATSMVWGRPGLARAHRVYRTGTLGLGKVEQKVKYPDKRKCAEIRLGNTQSVVPGSFHPASVEEPESAGFYSWDGGASLQEAISMVPEVKIGELVAMVREVVFCAAMVEMWPRLQGSRHDAMLGICGTLLKAGKLPARVQEMAEIIIEMGQDPDPADRRMVPSSTAARLAEGNDVVGYTLVDLVFGPEIAAWVGKMFSVVADRVESAGGIVLNDMGNGQLLCRLFGENMLYIANRKAWCAWNGQRWDMLGGDLVAQTYAKKTVEHMAGLATGLPSAAERVALRAHAVRSGGMGALRDMVQVSRDDLRAHESVLDGDPWLFNAPNGTIDLRTGDLRAHAREDRITRMGGVEYDRGAECPMWEEFIETVFAGDRGLVEFAQRMAGYAMTGRTSEQCMFFLFGHGKNGKTTFIETLSRLFGDYGDRTPADTFVKMKAGGMGPAISNDIAKLNGTRFVASKEVDQGVVLAESQIKDMTGGDTITARMLYENSITFRPIMKLVMYGNHKPTIYGQDEGIWRRIKLVPFTVQIAEDRRVRDYDEIMVREEGPGIMRWCVEGCLKWQIGGLGEPSAVEVATAGYKDEMDLFGSFFNDRYVANPKSKVAMEQVYAEYLSWCAEVGERPLSQRKMNEKFLDRGMEKEKSNGKWFLRGLSSLRSLSVAG